jgi:protein xylosyltransferase
MHYLRRELEKLESKFPSNVKVSKSPYSTIWGGAELLDMHLAVMKHLLEIHSWNWDFVINLSETDFPIK